MSNEEPVELSEQKIAKEMKENLEVVPYCMPHTHLFLTAVHKETSRNTIHRISCKKGIPIGGYIYDTTSDCYEFLCADYLQLGTIPASFMLKVKGLPSFEIRIPVAEAVIKRFLTPTQKKDVKNFKTTYKSENFSFEYIQLLDCN